MSQVDDLIHDMITRKVFASRSFSAREIAHSELPSNEDSSYLFEFAHFQQGYMQAIRDYLCFYFKKEVPITITSGYRDIEKNKAVGGVPNSMHIWRVGTPNQHGLQMITANDFRPRGISLKEAFEALEWVKGEVYLNTPKMIIHVSPFEEEPHFVV